MSFRAGRDRRSKLAPAVKRRLLLLPLAGAAGALAVSAFVSLPAGSAAANPTLRATVGPGFTITLEDSSGATVKHLDTGTYTIEVSDLSPEHDFHLYGPGVDEATSVEGTGTDEWTVTFTDGIYRYRCDAHPTLMKGQFAVGTATLSPPPPPAPKVKGIAKGLKLKGVVGPRPAISLKDTAGKAVKKVRAGRRYTIVVRDRSKAYNFHLSGPGVNRKTPVRKKVRAKWKLEFRKGKTYRFRSDAHSRRAMRRSFKAV